jgi:hypothetical protein
MPELISTEMQNLMHGSLTLNDVLPLNVSDAGRGDGHARARGGRARHPRPRPSGQPCLLESAALNQNGILASMDFVHAA